MYLHGNPFQTRKVVLSQELIDRNEFSKVTVPKYPKDMIVDFFKVVKSKSEEANRKNAPLLILVFCHGLANLQLCLDNGDEKKGLSLQYLKGAGAGCPCHPGHYRVLLGRMDRPSRS